MSMGMKKKRQKLGLKEEPEMADREEARLPHLVKKRREKLFCVWGLRRFPSLVNPKPQEASPNIPNDHGEANLILMG